MQYWLSALQRYIAIKRRLCGYLSHKCSRVCQCYITTGAQLAALVERARMFRSLHLAPSTRRAYATGVMAYARFAVYYRPHLPAFPASDEALAAFMTFQSQTCGYSTLKNYFYALREFHLARGHTFAPLADRHMVLWTLRGIRRLRSDVAQPKQAMTLTILCDIWRTISVDGEPLRGNTQTVWAAILVGFFGMLRKDNLTQGKLNAVNPMHGLRRGDVCFQTLGSGQKVAWLRVRMAKNNAFGERTHNVPLVASGTPLCPVAALQQHILDFPAPLDSPVFVYSPVGGRRPVPLSHTTFVTRLKGMLKAAGHDPSKFAGHSLRRGGATLAFRLHCPVQLIQLQGDWLSDVVYRYHEVSSASRLVLPAAMARSVMT
jgi:hypothetical protein